MNVASPPRPRLGLSVGITGHRPPLLDEEAERAARPCLEEILGELSAATAALRTVHPNLFDEIAFVPRFVSALAEGADQFGAVVALEAGYALQAILPLPRDDYRQDFEEAGAARFQLLLDRAERVLELPPQSSGRDESYVLGGRATVAHCDILIALWDGTPARGSGGTADVVSLALRRGVPVIHLATQPDAPGRILWTGYGEFVDPSDMESIPCKPINPVSLRDLARAVIGPPVHPHAIKDLRKYLAEHERRVRPRAEYPLMLAMLGVQRLRRSAFSSGGYEAMTRAEWRTFRDACAPELHGVGAELDEIERCFAWADRLAQHFGQIYRSGHVLNFTFGALAILIALSGLLLPRFEFLLALAEPSLIIVFVANTVIGSRRQWHRRWLEYRQLAERLRPMRSLKLLGAASPPSAQISGHATAGWTEWYARAAWRAAGCAAGILNDPACLSAAIAQEELKPQIDYNHASAKQMHLLDHRLHLAGIALFCLSILSCMVSVLVNLLFHDLTLTGTEIFIVASAGLPALGSAIFGIRVQGDFSTTAERSLMTADDLNRIATALASPAISLARQTDLLEAAAGAMLADVADWRRAYERRTLQLG